MLPNVASINSYGGPKNDYSSPKDASTDRSAAGVNPAYGDIAGLTHTGWRAWARLTVKSAGTAPVLVAHDETWNNGNNAAPVAARSSAGVLTIAYPTTVVDEIPSTSPGFIGAQTVNFLAAVAGNRGGTTWYQVEAVPTSANVVTLYFWKFSGGAPTIGDPGSDTDVDVWVR